MKSNKRARPATKKKQVTKKTRVVSAVPVIYPELKFYDLNQLLTSVPAQAAANTTYAKFFPVTGDDYMNRQGRAVQLRSIRVEGYWYGSQSNVTEEFQVGHVALVLDRSPNGDIATLGEVFAQVGGSLTGGGGTLFPNPMNKKRFKILYKEEFYFPKVVWGASELITAMWNLDQSQSMRYKAFIDCTKWKPEDQIVRFNATSGGTGVDLVENSILACIWVGNPSGVIAGSWDCSMVTRCAFVDV